MKLKIFDLYQALKFVMPAMGKNESRKNLMCIDIKFEGDKCRIMAADSFCIKIANTFIFYGDDKESSGNFQILSEQVKDIFSICNLHKGLKKERDDNYCILNSKLFSSRKSNVEIMPVSFEYPNLERLIDPEGKPSQDVGISLHFIDKVLKSFPNEAKLGVVKFSNFGNKAPFVITSQDGLFKSVLMPVRIQW
ncbi:MAG: hypothetical protein P8X74_03795 [Reinekea sp.]